MIWVGLDWLSGFCFDCLFVGLVCWFGLFVCIGYFGLHFVFWFLVLFIWHLFGTSGVCFRCFWCFLYLFYVALYLGVVKR